MYIEYNLICTHTHNAHTQWGLCYHTHSHSLTHTVLAVSGIQITIAVLGRFTDDRLPEYVDCLQTSLISEDGRIPENFSISGNSTFPVSREEISSIV